MSKTTIAPPIRYNRIQSTLARGGLPMESNLEFLKLYHVNTIIGLTPKSIYDDKENPNEHLIKFIEENNVLYKHFPTDSSVKDKGKNRGVPITNEQVTEILELILQKRNGQVYIYCLDGGQIVSLVVACLRKIQLWSNVSIFEEFICFSQSANNNDRMFVEEFVPRANIPSKLSRNDWLWTGLNENVIMNHPCLKHVQYS